MSTLMQYDTNSGWTGKTAAAQMMQSQSFLRIIRGGLSTSSTSDVVETASNLGPNNEVTNAGCGIIPNQPSTGSAVMELRRLSGFTWDQLARIFGVDRRALHFWASGKPLSAVNEERLFRLLAMLRKIDRGSAAENRALILAAQPDGVIPFELLISGNISEIERRLGATTELRRPKPGVLSAEERAARMPPKPEYLVDALHEKVHRDIGVARAVRTARRKAKK